MSNFMAPAELSKAFLGISKAKGTNTAAKLFILGILAGVYIGFAAHLATTIATGPWTGFFGLKKFFIGAVFSVGLMLVVIPGSELFTGNNLMTIGLLQGEITLKQLLRNWFIVYFGNLVGSILLAWIIAAMSGLTAGSVGATAINIAYAKVSVGASDHNIMYFFRGIGCNWLVCLAVMMAIAAKDIVGKVFAIFFPIMAFVASGFEHCVANMYFIPAGIFSKVFPKAVELTGKAEVLDALNWQTMFTQNIISVTLGNIVGGAIFVGCVYWWIYVRGSSTE